MMSVMARPYVARPRECRASGRKRGAVDVKQIRSDLGQAPLRELRDGEDGRATPGRRPLPLSSALSALAVAEPFVESLDQALRSFGDHRPGREDRVDACFAKRREILFRNDAADRDHRLAQSDLAERALQRRREREVPRRER